MSNNFHTVNLQSYLSSAARTSSGQSNGHIVSGFIEGRFLINISAVSGTDPTLDCKAAFSWDNSTYYSTDQSSTQLTSTGQFSIPVTNFGKYLRFEYAIGGSDTPTFTFTVDFLGKT